jgi:hypothetical protein
MYSDRGVKARRKIKMAVQNGPHMSTFQKNYQDVRFEFFTAATVKNAVFWQVTPCSSCENRRFGGT